MLETACRFHVHVSDATSVGRRRAGPRRAAHDAAVCQSPRLQLLAALDALCPCVDVFESVRGHMPRLAQILLLLLTGACHCRMENMLRAVRTWQPLLKRRTATLFS